MRQRPELLDGGREQRQMGARQAVAAEVQRGEAWLAWQQLRQHTHPKLPKVEGTEIERGEALLRRPFRWDRYATVTYRYATVTLLMRLSCRSCSTGIPLKCVSGACSSNAAAAALVSSPHTSIERHVSSAM